jgi:hypothetical protein
MGKRNSPAPSFALGVTPSFFWVAVKKIEHDNDNENLESSRFSADESLFAD